MNNWNWAPCLVADKKLHDMLMLITGSGSDAQSLVESVEGQGFEAWRLLNNRYNAVGEMYTFDKMNSLMHQVREGLEGI